MNHGRIAHVRTSGTACSLSLTLDLFRDLDTLGVDPGRLCTWRAVGEGAGAIELVLQAKYAVAAAWTQAGSPTMLTEQFVVHLGASDPTDMIEGLVTGRYRLRADAAPLVFEAAHAGDDVARRLVLWSAELVASMVLGVARQMHITDEEVEIVTGGSFFKAGSILIEPLQTLVLGEIRRARFTHVEAQPVLGAVLLAMRSNNLDADVITSARERMLVVDW